MLADLAWSRPEASAILRGLDFTPAGRIKDGGAFIRRRSRANAPAKPAPAKVIAATPFAALAAPAAFARAPQSAGGGRGRPVLRRSRHEHRRACRIDVWLWRARFAKTRSLAAKIVDDGRVRLTRAGLETRLDKPSRTVKAGDQLVFALGGKLIAIRVGHGGAARTGRRRREPSMSIWDRRRTPRHEPPFNPGAGPDPRGLRTAARWPRTGGRRFRPLRRPSHLPPSPAAPDPTFQVTFATVHRLLWDLSAYGLTIAADGKVQP